MLALGLKALLQRTPRLGRLYVLLAFVHGTGLVAIVLLMRFWRRCTGALVALAILHLWIILRDSLDDTRDSSGWVV